MSPMRIGYVINVFPKLSETFIAVEMAELQRRGFEILPVSLRTPAETLRHAMIESSGLLDRTIYPPADALAALRDFKPDLLHAHFATEPAGAARQFAQCLHIPFTFTAHGYDIFRKPPSDFSARATEASAVITVSRANAEYIERTFSVAREKVHVIPCGVDTDLFKPLSPPAFND